MNNKKIQKILKKIHVKSLTLREQDVVWERIRFDMTQTPIQKAMRSHVLSHFKKSIAITLIFGLTAGTAFAADSAKPGDRLFVIDRALEGIQMSVASEGKKDELRVKFALERVKEVKDIFEEIDVHSTNTSIKTAPKEADRFVETVTETDDDTSSELIKPELETDDVVADEMVIANSEDDTEIESDKIEDTGDTQVEDIQTEDVIEITDSIPTEPKEDTNLEITPDEPDLSDETPELIDSEEVTEVDPINNNTGAINVEHIEKQLKQIGVDPSLSDSDKKRIELALGTALSFLGDVKGELIEQENTDAVSHIDLMLDQLNNEIASLPENIIFEIDLSAKKDTVKFEITSQDNKPKVQIEIQGNDEPDTKTEEPQTPTESTQATLKISDGGLEITPQEKTVVVGEEIPDEDTEPQEVENKNDSETETVIMTEEDGDKKKENEDETLLDVEITIERKTDDELNTEKSEDESLEEEPTEETTEVPVTDPTVNTEETQQEEGQEEEDDVTTVKMIIKEWDGDLEFILTDKNANIHDIIEEHTQI